MRAGTEYIPYNSALATPTIKVHLHGAGANIRHDKLGAQREILEIWFAWGDGMFLIDDVSNICIKRIACN